MVKLKQLGLPFPTTYLDERYIGLRKGEGHFDLKIDS